MARTILVIDDEPSIRQALSGVLTDEGHRVRCAASGLEGIEALRTERPMRFSSIFGCPVRTA
jgi:CheY-like chemotaxis protein